MTGWMRYDCAMTSHLFLGGGGKSERSNGAVRVRGRDRKTTFRQTGMKQGKKGVHRDSEHGIVAPTIPIYSLKACGLTQGKPPEYPFKKIKHKNGDDIFE
jgi:hypothetical protein